MGLPDARGGEREEAMVLSEVFRVQNIAPDLKSSHREELLVELVDFLAAHEGFDERAKARILEGIRSREEMLSTIITPSIALPHASLRGQRETLGAFGVSRQGVDWGSPAGKPVHIVMLLVDDRYETRKHLKMLQKAAELIGSPNFYSKIMGCKTAEEIFGIITEIEEMQRV